MPTLLRRPTLTLASAGCLLILAVFGCRDNPLDSSIEANQSQALAPAVHKAEGGAVLPFSDAEVFFEFNTTDNDLGFQVFLDAEGWNKVDISDPANSKVVQVMTQGPLAELGITELSTGVNNVQNGRGENLMQSSFVQNGQTFKTEDVWFANKGQGRPV